MDNGIFIILVIPLIPIPEWKVNISSEVGPYLGIILYHQKLASHPTKKGWTIGNSGASTTTMACHVIHPPTHQRILNIQPAQWNLRSHQWYPLQKERYHYRPIAEFLQLPSLAFGQLVHQTDQ